MSLDARLGADVGGFRLDDVTFRVDAGATVAVVGPNGAGKTTALRVLAGLIPLETGRVTLDNVVLDDPATGTYLAPERRPVGVVFQDLLLFPHLTVRENVAFGLRARKLGRREARRRADEWLARLGLGPVADARPGALSGGQAQRVALARALAVEPRLVLLDEPLSALDATLRPEVRRDLARHLAGFGGAAVVVTHDPLEAMALAERLVVLEDGRVTQAGTADEVRERPRSRYVADLVGVNLYRGTAGPDGLELDDGALLVSAERGARGPAFGVVHPRAVALHLEHPEGTPRNVWHGTVRHVDHEGDRARVRVDAVVPVTAEVTAAAVAELALRAGAPVWASVKASEVAVYPA